MANGIPEGFEPLSEDELQAFDTASLVPPIPPQVLSAPLGFEALTAEEQEEAERPLTLQDVRISAMRNLAPSAKKFVSDIVSVAKEPVKTINALERLATGALFAISPGEDISSEGETEAEIRAQGLDPFLAFLDERFGGVENIKRTIATDPVGFAADIAGFAGGVGAAGRTLGVLTEAPRVVRAGEIVSKIGQSIDPISGTAKAVVGATNKLIPNNIPERLINSALKTPDRVGGRRLTPQDRLRIAKTALEENVSPNLDSLERIDLKIDQNNERISAIIKEASKDGRTVKVDDVLSRLDELKKQTADTVDPFADLDIITQIENNFKKQVGGKTIPAARAQAIKKNTNKALRKQYGELKGSAIEAKKQINRGIKEEISDLFPEIDRLNKKDTELLRLNEVLEKAVGRIEKSNLLPLRSAATGSVKGGLFTFVLDDPIVKVAFARALNKARRLKPGAVVRPVERAGFQAGRAQGLLGEIQPAEPTDNLLGEQVRQRPTPPLGVL
jgi:hypothetical protein